MSEGRGIESVDRMDGLMKPMGLRPVAGYIRVSRIGGRSGEGYISPDEQRVQIERYAAELGLQIAVDAWGDDQDRSGGTFDRPGWEKVIRRIESGELGGVIVMRVDRFARNVPDGAAQIRRIVNDCNAFFGSAQERMDATTPSGIYMLQQFLNNAELQLNMLKGSWKVAKERAIKRGAHIGPTPLGYGRIPKGAERAGCLFPLPEWKPIIAALFQRAATTSDGNKLIANYMNKSYPRPDGRQWTSPTVGHVIENRVHLGEVSYRPKRTEFLPLVNTEAHEPMIDEATWLAAQRKPGVQRTNADDVNILAGLLRCSGCRYRMSQSRAGKMVRVYRCVKNHGAGICQGSCVVDARRIEEYVLAQVRDQWEARFAVSLTKPGVSIDADDIARRLAEARVELEAFANDLSARRLLGGGYHAALETRASAVGALEAEWDAHDTTHERVGGGEICWEALEPREIRELLAGALDAVFIRRGRSLAVEDRTCLVWAGELDDDVPARGKAAPILRPFEWPENNRTSVRVAAA